ncbi:hypothetical protein K457DRAFT_175174 [Linnemannia elongata AG-77]|uniref:Uncharacterized protein n=1 Tax=Linnemannia elongata AG-77 TaxID=1314771 RepID=A0A197KK77_9FUNG|nr:hypothetical protein K457DRAFT_175174 [Linnemannia elongata AG-77]
MIAFIHMWFLLIFSFFVALLLPLYSPLRWVEPLFLPTLFHFSTMQEYPYTPFPLPSFVNPIPVPHPALHDPLLILTCFCFFALNFCLPASDHSPFAPAPARMSTLFLCALWFFDIQRAEAGATICLRVDGGTYMVHTTL